MAEAFLYIRVFSTGFSHMIFPLASGHRVTMNTFPPFQTDVTNMSDVLGKFVHWLGFAVCLMECILGVLHSTSDALREAFNCL